MTAHRYWRILITATQGSSAPARLGRISLPLIGWQTASTGGNDITLASSYATGTHRDYAWMKAHSDGFKLSYGSGFDEENEELYWQANATGDAWIGGDWGSGSTVEPQIMKIQAVNSPTISADGAPTAFTLQCSDDGTTWTDVESFTSPADWMEGETRFFYRTTCPAEYLPVEGTKYWRLTFRDSGIAQLDKSSMAFFATPEDVLSDTVFTTQWYVDRPSSGSPKVWSNTSPGRTLYLFSPLGIELGQVNRIAVNNPSGNGTVSSASSNSPSRIQVECSSDRYNWTTLNRVEISNWGDASAGNNRRHFETRRRSRHPGTV